MEINGVLFVSQLDNELVLRKRAVDLSRSSYLKAHNIRERINNAVITLKPPEFHGLDGLHILTQME